MNKFLRELSVVFVATCLVLVYTSNFGLVKGSVEVNGIIESDTVWTKTNSPYNLTGNLLVANDVTLTIEAGVTVNFDDNDYYLQVNGTLNAIGSITEPIYFNNGRSIKFTQYSSGWNELTQTGSIIENAILDGVSVEVNGSQKIGNNTFALSAVNVKGGTPLIANNYIQGAIVIEGGSPEIKENVISDEPRYDWFSRGVYTDYGILVVCFGDSQPLIAENVITGQFDVAAIKVEVGDPVIEKNLIINNRNYRDDSGSQSGILIEKSTSPVIRSNTITENFRGITCRSSSATISNNNIKDNSNYNIYLRSGSAGEVNATYNWWGTTNTTTISQTIYDYQEDFELGTVNFVPFLTEPNPEAPKVSTELSILADGISSVTDTQFKVHGMLTDSQGYIIANVQVTVSYSVTANNWIQVGSSNTSSDAGQYFVPWLNTESGTFTLKAEWNGNDEHLGTSATTTFTSLNYQNQNTFFIQSETKITDLEFNATNAELTFKIDNTSGNTGSVVATIPKDLLSTNGNWIVTAEGNTVTQLVWENENRTVLQITYGPDAENIKISGTTAVPEFSSIVLLSLFLTATLAAIATKKSLHRV